MRRERTVAQRGQLVEQLGPTPGGEVGRDADVVQRAGVVVQAEQQRADTLAVLVHPVTGQHALGGAQVLHLHQRALIRRVRVVEPLGDDAVETGALELDEPALGRRGVGGRRAAMDGRPGTGEHLVEQRPPLGERPFEQDLVAQCQQVEGDERCRGLGRKSLHARRGGVDALQQRIEVEAATARGGHDDLAIDHTAVGQRGGERAQQLGEVPGERAFVAARQLDLVAVAEDDATEPVPLRFVEPALGRTGRCDRDPLGRLGEHRGDRRTERELHRTSVPAAREALARMGPAPETRGSVARHDRGCDGLQARRPAPAP